MTFEKEPENTFRYTEVPASGQPPISLRCFAEYAYRSPWRHGGISVVGHQESFILDPGRDNHKNEASPLPSGRFRVICADPPWKYNNSGLDDYSHAEGYYPTMSIAELCAMDLPPMDRCSW
jgi:hypothetical protein